MEKGFFFFLRAKLLSRKMMEFEKVKRKKIVQEEDGERALCNSGSSTRELVRPPGGTSRGRQLWVKRELLFVCL